MSPFLTVKGAGALVNKSPSSIRRIIYPILEDDKHADRHYIEPLPETARELRMKGEGFAWRISEELLRRVVPAETSSEKGSGTPPERDHGEGNGALLDMLRRELDIKNTQITQQSELISKQMELIGGLSERLREGARSTPISLMTFNAVLVSMPGMRVRSTPLASNSALGM